jgi:putative ATP-grasp target RiPP
VGLRLVRLYPPVTAEAGCTSIRLDPVTQVTVYLDAADLPVDLPVAVTTSATRSMRPTNQDGASGSHPVLDTKGD